jgi:phage shock protein PspC (stress-responsive transcriptional regulator)
MQRSFTDRVFGGVCGGLAASWHINAWLIRLLLAAFTLVSLGGGVILYLALWWAMPQQSLLLPRRGHSLQPLLVMFIILVIAGAWALQQTGSVSLPEDRGFFWPVALLLLSVIFFLRQIRG